ncbi:multiple coagulation factor deficiency protein 2 homolog isoform X2 [Tribolium castaneum]|uniref:multiple coagulation factor deficiency protein 2 homolog isoform X2 n=1 Tax=Tribolium castaneum TaxID=7070 RepID=UPI00077DEEED|nr:PREDICTED: multiple coagulation factor deficiency protein 2 isoform X2 [Tribolium castaneum]|eukprot:XP_015840742.1 PREDICTED: multiple coagulation factor deficiency protein 2 isoform X2 [Tribolium castaneum]
MLALLACFSSVFLISVHAQRAPPGVPPQHYQGVPPQQQYQHVPVQQQVPVQHQQVPVQHQQVPMQHVPMQQQVPMQQVPLQQQAPQHHHGQPQQILNAANIAHEKEHIAEHMEVPIDTSKMSEQELQFHYFKMHDADNNNKLDGCELIKSLIHWHGKRDIVSAPLFDDDTITQLVDQILQLMDRNIDGFVDYGEYRLFSGNNK